MMAAYYEEMIAVLWIIVSVLLGILAAITKQPLWLLPGIAICLYGFYGLIIAMRTARKILKSALSEVNAGESHDGNK